MEHKKEFNEIIETGKRMLNSALTVGTWGNISLRIADKELFAITPSGMDYDQLRPEDIVVIDFEGNIISGERTPSIENPLHRIIYKSRDDIQAIVHTHSIYASAMACARKGIPAAMEDLAQIVGGDVRVSEYYLPGTEEVGNAAVKAMENRNGALLANHGVVGIGRDLKEAMTVCQIIEKGAQMTIAAQGVGGLVELEQEDVDIMRDFFLNGYGQK